MPIKIIYELQTNKLVIEGEEGDLVGLLKMVQELIPSIGTVSIVRPSLIQSNLVASTSALASPEMSPNSPVRDLGVREFARRFAVDTAFDRIAVIGYYANKIKQNPTFTVKEMGDWFGLCGFAKPKNMAVAFSDTKRKKEFIDSKGRDQWCITTIGENFVMDLLESLPSSQR
jgi:hypothetical protein